MTWLLTLSLSDVASLIDIQTGGRAYKPVCAATIEGVTWAQRKEGRPGGWVLYRVLSTVSGFRQQRSLPHPCRGCAPLLLPSPPLGSMVLSSSAGAVSNCVALALSGHPRFGFLCEYECKIRELDKGVVAW